MVKKLWLSLVLVVLAAAVHAAEPAAPMAPKDTGGLCAAQVDQLSPAGLPEPLLTGAPTLECTSPLCRTVADCFGFPCGDYTFCSGATQFTCGTCECY